MLLTEYDEKSHMRSIYEDGEEAGYRRGEQDGYQKGEQNGYRKGEADLLAKMVRQKLERGKSISVIAEELETEVSVIEKIADKIKNLS